MEQTLVVVFCLFVACAWAKTKQTRHIHYLPLEDKGLTTGVMSKSNCNVASECARPCANLNMCESFFYNTMTGECQYHDVVFTSSAGATEQKGLQYYFIIKGRNKWCPVQKGFQLLAENGPCVKFHTDKKSWYEANQTCEAYSPYSRLVVLDSKEKNDLVKATEIAINDQFNDALWMGLREYTRDTFRWVSKQLQDLNFTNWSPLHKSTRDEEHCVAHHRKYGWSWSQYPCRWQLHYICEVVVGIIDYHKIMDTN